MFVDPDEDVAEDDEEAEEVQVTKSPPPAKKKPKLMVDAMPKTAASS